MDIWFCDTLDVVNVYWSPVYIVRCKSTFVYLLTVRDTKLSIG